MRVDGSRCTYDPAGGYGEVEQFSKPVLALLPRRRKAVKAAELFKASALAGADRMFEVEMFGPDWVPERLDAPITPKTDIRRSTASLAEVEEARRRSGGFDAVADVNQIEEPLPADVAHGLRSPVTSSAGSWQIAHMIDTTRPPSIKKLPESK